MTYAFSNQFIHKQLIIGCHQQGPIGAGNNAIQGCIGAHGVVNIGGEGFGYGEATLMVETSVKQKGDRALKVKGCAAILPAGGSVSLTNSAGQTVDVDNPNTANGLPKVKAPINPSATDAGVPAGTSAHILYVGGNAFFDHPNIGDLNIRFSTADAKGKTFNMEHPTLGEGHRLVHACIEGPEIGVYFRGRLRNKKEIVLPYYWKDLVHTDSISVQLQPIGAHQDIIVKRWDNEKIYLQSNGGLPIDCFYHVYAERKDVNPLYVEYDGSSWMDYPDPNHANTTGNYNDPQYKGPRNTFTA